MLYFKYFSTPESQAQLQKSKQRLKRLIKLKKRKNNFFNLKPNVYFFENKFTLVSKQQNHISTSIALEDFNKFKNFNKDVYIKDEFITQNNNLSKQQRWLSNNYIGNSRITLSTNKHILTKNFLDNPLLKENLLSSNI
jgi:hypothetical protein